VAELRWQYGWDVPTLSKRSGVSVSTIKKLEAGHISLPHPRTVQRLAVDGFGISVRELTRGERSDDYINVRMPRHEAATLGLVIEE
jgi:transcriptional regulator with XRE-family HTH domain